MGLLDRLLASLDVRVRAFAVCRVARGWSLALDPAETTLLHYVARGSGRLTLADGSYVPFRVHDLIVVPPRCATIMEVPGAPAPNRARGMEHCESLAEGWLAMATPGAEGAAGAGQATIVTACGAILAAFAPSLGLFDRLQRPLVLSLPEADALRASVEGLLEELARPGIGGRVMADALLKQCLILVVRRLAAEAPADAAWLFGQADPRLLKALEQILEDPSGDHRLASLARAAAMSRSAFATRFALGFGRSPIAFLREVRLRRAARMLEESDLSVADVAKAVGYESRTYFSRAFRAAYGADPQSFRAAQRRSRSVPHR